jgi:hypothetical protein
MLPRIVRPDVLETFEVFSCRDSTISSVEGVWLAPRLPATLSGMRTEATALNATRPRLLEGGSHMPVWYVYRSFDVAPTGKHLQRFDDDTVLEWFQRNWGYLAVEDIDLADERLIEVLGHDGWPLSMPFVRSAEQGLPPPESIEDVLVRMRASFGNEEVSSPSPHVVEMMTEEDGEGGAVYFFDGHFLKESGFRTAYLLHDDWRLPPGSGDGSFTPTAETKELEPVGNGPGATYAVFLVRESKYPIDDLSPAWRIDGVRLPDLARHLLAAPPASASYLRLLPELAFAGVSLPEPMDEAFLSAVRTNSSDAANWAAWSDWRAEHGEESPGIGLLRAAFARMARLPGSVQDQLVRRSPTRSLLEMEAEHRDQLRQTPKSLLHGEEHLIQMCLDGSHDDDAGPYFGQWILFDDLWASAHPELADALLTWCARWDVLTGG